MREDELIRDSHPASPLAHELRRFAAFTLERLPGPRSILLLRASAPGDERLLALAEVERFALAIEGDLVRVPAFEQVFLDAAQALRAALRSAGPRAPVLNRIALAIRPPVDLSREQVQALAERLAPSIYDLNLEKVSLLGTFALGKDHAPRELWVEWKDPIALGLRFGIVLPRRRPVAVRTAYPPEYTAYQYSPHARVGCVKCHIGSGADWFVRSKVSGSYQVYATLFNKYPRPIPTPIQNLRPALETCEKCHWPKHFFSEKLQKHTYYLSDEQNTPWNLELLLKIGGVNVEAGPTSGIHWHMNISNEITYFPSDSTRQVIPWVRLTDETGRVTVYRSKDPSLALSDEQIAAAETQI